MDFVIRHRFALIAAIAAGFLSTPARGQNLPAETASTSNLAIGPGDMLDIAVSDVTELTLKVRVDGDGTVDLPLVGKDALGANCLSVRRRVCWRPNWLQDRLRQNPAGIDFDQRIRHPEHLGGRRGQSAPASIRCSARAGVRDQRGRGADAGIGRHRHHYPQEWRHRGSDHHRAQRKQVRTPPIRYNRVT